MHASSVGGHRSKLLLLVSDRHFDRVVDARITFLEYIPISSRDGPIHRELEHQENFKWKIALPRLAICAF